MGNCVGLSVHICAWLRGMQEGLNVARQEASSGERVDLPSPSWRGASGTQNCTTATNVLLVVISTHKMTGCLQSMRDERHWQQADQLLSDPGKTATVSASSYNLITPMSKNCTARQTLSMLTLWPKAVRPQTCRWRATSGGAAWASPMPEQRGWRAAQPAQRHWSSEWNRAAGACRVPFPGRHR